MVRSRSDQDRLGDFDAAVAADARMVPGGGCAFRGAHAYLWLQDPYGFGRLARARGEHMLWVLSVAVAWAVVTGSYALSNFRRGVDDLGRDPREAG